MEPRQIRPLDDDAMARIAQLELDLACARRALCLYAMVEESGQPFPEFSRAYHQSTVDAAKQWVLARSMKGGT